MELHSLLGGKLGAAVGASVVLHAGLLGSLDQFIGGAGAPEARGAPPLRARLVALADAAPAAPPALPPVAGRPEPGRRASELAAAGALPLLRGPQYFSADELDQRPLALTNITLDYPAGVRPREETVVARILINEAGGADEVQILSPGTDAGFAELVQRAFGGATYRPGQRKLRPVKSQLTVEVKFVPESAPAEER